MTERPNLHSLAPTSALVLLCCEDAATPIFNSPWAKKYLAQLDLSSGRELYQSYEKFAPNYNKIIQLRKQRISYFANQFLKENAGGQVIILAAGSNPLGFDLRFKFKNAVVFELDYASLADKDSFVAGNLPEARDSFRFIQADLRDPDSTLSELIAKADLDPTKPTLIIAEGISYYLEKNVVLALFSALSSKCVNLSCIFEYIRPLEELEPAAAEVSRAVFGLISEYCGTPEPTRYSAGDLKKLVGALCCSATKWELVGNAVGVGLMTP